MPSECSTLKVKASVQVVSVAPFFDGKPSLINRPDGSVLFECLLNGTPQPSVAVWFKDKECSGDRYTTKVKKQARDNTSN